MGSDLIVFTGWWSVALCGAAAVVVFGLRRARWSRPMAVAAWCEGGFAGCGQRAVAP
jgi:hypothetical protein